MVLLRSLMRVAVVGAGINGVMSAWALARRGHEVELFERGEPMAGTSSASTKLLHGGLRYLETGDVSLVREGLRERAWWIEQAPRIAHPLELLLPVVRGRGRPRWMVKAGLVLYDRLSGRRLLAPHRWLGRDEVLARLPGLRAEGLLGAYAFWDGQMDDRALGLWALGQAQAAGVRARTHCEVTRLAPDGTLSGPDVPAAPFDAVCNLAGPGAGLLLERSGLPSRHRLRLVRGSHLLVDGSLPCGLLVQAPSDRRVCFILPYGGRVMIGTTEVEQGPDEPVAPSPAERDYLLEVWNASFERRLSAADVRESFAGVRPLLAQAGDANANTREHAIERHGRVLSVFGGKWTTSRSLGEQVADEVERGP
ncbi:MAG TPA: glycerol-3-phosphate dehydrogenase/oxidase [Quisquiliibacterium sp.]|nr:glycerol-3-phosphate dehydrogenase/oxidase [Quisquiliibacterium sp.]